MTTRQLDNSCATPMLSWQRWKGRKSLSGLSGGSSRAPKVVKCLDRGYQPTGTTGTKIIPRMSLTLKSQKSSNASLLWQQEGVPYVVLQCILLTWVFQPEKADH